MEDLAVMDAVIRAAATHQPVALATVVRTRGSVPRRAGSRMVIDPGHGMVGTIGGGCGEADVIVAAREVVATGLPKMVRVELMDSPDSWSPPVCGGVMETYVEPVS